MTDNESSSKEAMELQAISEALSNHHYQLWSDVLHAKALAHETNNDWDRGTYVRWTVISAVVVLELACQEAFGHGDFGRRFKETMNQLVEEIEQPPVDWGKGLWQAIADLRDRRSAYVHRIDHLKDQFPASDQADEAIQLVREAVECVFRMNGKEPPKWASMDYDRGWARKGFSVEAHPCIGHGGASVYDPASVRIGYTYKEKDFICEVWPPNTAPIKTMLNLATSLQIPVSRVFAVSGDTTLAEVALPFRGS